MKIAVKNIFRLYKNYFNQVFGWVYVFSRVSKAKIYNDFIKILDY